MTNSVRVSILIKALNEEAKIARCLEAAVREISEVGGEVILVDSLSTDRTVEIARGFPVRIVQFENVADRGCGAAVQLGYQFARGEFLYLIDGDMVLQPGFLSRALDYLDSNLSVAGVGGLIVDTQTNTYADQMRTRSYSKIVQPIMVDHLGGGGLYRRNAIESVGYLANRWLKACEEAELGVRLRSAGWLLSRLPVVAVFHTGHSETNFGMLKRLWRSRRMHAYGSFLSSAIGQSWWWASARLAWYVFVAPAMYMAAILIAAMLFPTSAYSMFTTTLIVVALLWSGTFVVLAFRKKNISEAALAILYWHLYSIAALPRLIGTVHDLNTHISGREIT